jgi:ACS family hexuronate transporter-like MFS transporter
VRSRIPLRWVVMGVFVLSSALNYLDRQILAALAPLLRAEFNLSNADYGQILTAFSITYALCSPLAGLFVDRVGLNRGVSLGVGAWSLAGIATGFVNGLRGLLACRAALGVAESSGIPATGKALHKYLLPRERALGNAVSQIGLSIGAIVAPPLATWLALRHGWRSAFIVTGLLGFVWIPLWLSTARRVPASQLQPGGPRVQLSEMLRDSRLWGFIIANFLSMTVYTLWTNWTTLYLVEEQKATLVTANWLASIPAFFAYLGGLSGGWLSLRWMNAGLEALEARRRVCLVSALALLATAAVPLMPSAAWATVAISLSFFSIASWSVNLYTMPLDAFGGEHAAFGVSMLTFAYGAMQAVVSPLFGAVIDRYGYTPVFVFVSLMPMAAYGILRLTARRP